MSFPPNPSGGGTPDTDTFLIERYIPGVVSAGAMMYWYAPEACDIIAASIGITGVPSSGACTVDITKEFMSIFTSAPSIPTGSTSMSGVCIDHGVIDTMNNHAQMGDLFAIQIVSAPATTSGLLVQILCKRV